MTTFFTRLHLLCSLALITLVALTGCTPPPEQPVLRIIAIDPGSEAVLGVQQRFYLQFAVNAKVPLTVTVDPYFQREALSTNLATSAPVTLPAGGGTAVAHLLFWGDYATRVDEIRLVARVAGQREVHTELAVPVKLSWVTREVAPRPTPAWAANTQKSDADVPAKIDARSQWLAFGAVIIAIAIGGFGSRCLRKRRAARRNQDDAAG